MNANTNLIGVIGVCNGKVESFIERLRDWVKARKSMKTEELIKLLHALGKAERKINEIGQCNAQ